MNMMLWYGYDLQHRIKVKPSNLTLDCVCGFIDSMIQQSKCKENEKRKIIINYNCMCLY